MALRLIGKNWKDELLNAIPLRHRFYANFRQREYPHVSGTPGFELVDADQIGHWRLGEGTGTQAGDRSVNRNHGTIAGNPTWTAGPDALGGYALTLDGTGDWVSMGNVLTWDGTSARTFAGWFKTSNAAATQVLMGKRLATGGNEGWEVLLDTGQDLQLQLDGGATALACEYQAQLADGAWHHFAIPYDGSQLVAGVQIWVDGVSRTVTSITDTLAASIANAAALTLGARNAGAAVPLTGSLADCRIFNRVLTPDEITALYTDGTFNRPGSHLLVSGTLQYLVPMTESFTLRVMARPRFAFDVGSNQALVQWFVDATHFSRIFYRDTSNQHAFQYEYHDGGTARNLTDDAETADTIHEWRLFDVAIDLAGGQTGSAFYIDRELIDADFGASPDAFTTQQPIFTINAANYDIAYVELIPNYVATAADVANDYRDVLDERIYWGFNGHALGRARCLLSIEDVSSDGFGLQRRVMGIKERHVANGLALQMANEAGQYSDDQFAAWAPASKSYNGTAAQAYLQQRPWLWAEVFDGKDVDGSGSVEDGGNVDSLFFGRIDESRITRTTSTNGYPLVSLSAQDMAAEIKRRTLRDSVAYDGHDLSDTTAESTSLVHKITREATQGRVRNLASNSSFENATITNSWAANGGGSIARAADPLLGTYALELTNDADGSGFQQVITFTGDRKLNVGQNYTFTIFVKSATGQDVDVTITEADSGGDNDSTSAVAVTLAGGDGFNRLEVTHQITDATSDRLRISGTADGNVLVSYWDCAMLTETREGLWYFVLNADDGAAGVYDADDAGESTYDTHGFDVDQVDIEHPYKVIPADADLWAELSSLADSCIPQYLGFGQSGELIFRCRLAVGYADPPISDVLTDDGSLGGAITVEQMVSQMRGQIANRIVVHGPSYLETTREMMVWSARYAGIWDVTASGLITELIANNGFFPVPADYPGGIWVAFSLFVGNQGQLLSAEENWRKTTRPVYGGPPRGMSPAQWARMQSVAHEPYPTPEEAFPDVDFVAILSPRMTHSSIQSSVTGQHFTQTVFDTTTRPGFARFQFQNASGSSATMIETVILGQPIYRVFGRYGWIHDSLIDEDHIRLNGDMPYTLKTDYLVTLAQINQVADFIWKHHAGGRASSSAKHIYQPHIHGLLYWVQPGAWYRLDLGAAATAEDVDVDFDAFRLNTDVRGNFGMTRLDAFEVEKNWTADANAEARYLSSGGQTRWLDSDDVVVAPVGYGGKASSYCDGADDDVQIQAAIDELEDLGGGVVYLVNGNYSTGAAIVLKANVTLQMSSGTTITPDGDFDCFQVTGSAGSEVSGVTIQGGTVDAANLTTAAVLDADFADRLSVFGLKLVGGFIGISGDDCDDISVASCFFELQIGDATGGAIRLDTCTGEIRSNTFDGLATPSAISSVITVTDCVGLKIIGNTIKDYHQSGTEDTYAVLFSGGGGTSNVISDNIISGFRMYGVGVIGGIIASGELVQVTNNRVSNMRTFTRNTYGGLASAIGINMGVGADDCLFESNVVTDCDLGIFSSADGGRFYGNTARDNGSQVERAGCEDATTGPSLDLTGSPDAPSNATWARSTDQVYSGTYSFRLRVTTGGTVAIAHLNDNTGATNDLHDQAAGLTYRIKCKCYVEDPLPAEVTLRFTYHDGGATNNDVSPVGSGAWEELSMDVTVPGTATGITVNVRIGSTASTNEDVYFDEFSISVVGTSNTLATQFDDSGGSNSIEANNSWN